MKGHTVFLSSLILFTLGACRSETREFSVGFQYLELQDSTRQYDSVPRPVNLFVWYPADQGGVSMGYGDYFEQDQKRIPHLKDGEPFMPFLKEPVEKRLSPENLEKCLELPLDINMNAPRTGGHYPLILYFPGGGRTGYTHSFLCEELARSGFIVVGISSLGIDQVRNPGGLAGLELEMEDLYFAYKSVKARYPLSGKIGLLSFTQRSNASQILLKMK